MTRRIDFIIPAFNAARTLGDTLESLLAQTDRCWGAIVVDDGSTDRTADLVRTIRDGRSERRLVLVRQANTGLAGARNTGLSLARADLICFLDADDTIDPAFVATMTHAIDDYDLVACATRMVDSDLGDLGWTIAPQLADTTIERLGAFNPFTVGSVVMRRSAPRTRGVLGANTSELFDPSLPVHEDWDLWLRLTAAGARWAPPVPDALFNYRLRPGSMTSDIEQMHAVGLTVIARTPTDASARAAASRAWTLRHLARAIAAGDAALTSALLDRVQLDPSSDPDANDLGVLTGALAHAMMQADRVGPPSTAQHRARWQARVSDTLGAGPLTDVLTTHLATLEPDWSEIASRVLAMLEPGQALVVYGVGRNGRSLLTALDHIEPKPAVRWIDDHPAASCDRFERITRDQLDTHQVVFVTPDDAHAIFAALHAQPTARVLTRSSLAKLQSPPAQAVSSR